MLANIFSVLVINKQMILMGFRYNIFFVTIWASCTEKPYWAVYDNQISSPMGASITEEPGRAVYMMSGFILK